jgi:hypothetical protein
MAFMCVPLVRSTLGANVILFDAFLTSSIQNS